jgi:large subunit ribosomal protein L32
MAVPKHKTSKSVRDKRRTHKKIEAAATTTCPECGEAIQPHHACPSCGSYKGRKAVETEES